MVLLHLYNNTYKIFPTTAHLKRSYGVKAELTNNCNVLAVDGEEIGIIIIINRPNLIGYIEAKQLNPA